MSSAIRGLYLKTLIIFLEDKITRFVSKKNGKNEKICVGDVVLTTSLKNSTASTATKDATLDCVTVCTSAQTSKDIARYEIVGSTSKPVIREFLACGTNIVAWTPSIHRKGNRLQECRVV
jgi:hypothetical protein